jgi:hypothetical protein
MSILTDFYILDKCRDIPFTDIFLSSPDTDGNYTMKKIIHDYYDVTNLALDTFKRHTRDDTLFYLSNNGIYQGHIFCWAWHDNDIIYDLKLNICGFIGIMKNILTTKLCADKLQITCGLFEKVREYAIKRNLKIMATCPLDKINDMSRKYGFNVLNETNFNETIEQTLMFKYLAHTGLTFPRICIEHITQKTMCSYIWRESEIPFDCP